MLAAFLASISISLPLRLNLNLAFGFASANSIKSIKSWLFKKDGKTIREISYIADFVYEQGGKIIVEDVKGMQTKEFKLKRKMFEYQFPELTLTIV